jgi:predicted unusual protein kinase regulating ubiquinone biosynthesis (AarF/ABC1/UbiB family)
VGLSPPDERIPTGRLRRAAKTTGALAPGSLKLATTIAGNVGRDPDKAAAILARRHEDLADEIVTVLASLRGAAMKIGQMASFLDVDFIPAEYRDVYQEKLAALRDAAPPMTWKQVKRVLEEEWEGDRVEDLFEDFEQDTAAAASIGQVHRATLADGRVVAVKVQYPEIADALEADLGTAAIIGRLGKAIAPGVDPDLIVAEVRERVMEELDYELEAQNQRLFARAHRGHPFAYVPDVVTSLSRRRVLVSEWVDGEGFAQILERPAAERGDVAEKINRFFFGGVNYMGRFNADPHPGNYMLLDDGRMAFIDFGTVKAVDTERMRAAVRVFEAAKAGDDEELVRIVAEMGYVRDGARPDVELMAASFRGPRRWLVTDEEITIDRAFMARIIANQSQINGASLRLARQISLPPDDLMLQRMELGVLAVVAQLGATRNWYRIAREGWYGDESQTELGLAEQAFWRSRGVKPILTR